MIDDIQALVDETFNFSAIENTKNAFNYDEPIPSFDEEISIPTRILPEQAPGVFYNVEVKGSTFVIRVYPSKDLLLDYYNITKYPEQYPTLRLLSDDGKSVEDKLQFFECDNIIVARAIKEQLANKRFPLHEEHVFNVSDPGDSWWIKVDKGELKIFFKLSRTESMGSLVKLGPIGDGAEALEKFKALYGYFQLLFPVEDFSSAYGQFYIKCKYPNDPVYRDFVNLITDGDSGHEFWEFLRALEINSQDKPYLESLQRANFFVMQIGALRKFWKGIETQLNLD